MSWSIPHACNFIIKEILITAFFHVFGCYLRKSLSQFLVAHPPVGVHKVLSDLLECIISILAYLKHFLVKCVACLPEFPVPDFAWLVIWARHAVTCNVSDATVLCNPVPTEQTGVFLSYLICLQGNCTLILPHRTVEVMLVSMLILELFLECLVLSAKHPLHEQQMWEYLWIVTWHLLEQSNVAIFNVIISYVHHRCTEDWFFIILSHNQTRVGGIARDGAEWTRDAFGHFVMVYISANYNLHVVAILVSVPEFAHHFTSDNIFYVFLLA